MSVRHTDLDAIFCVQHERSVAADNTVTVGGLRLQIAPQSSRWSYAKCRVKVCEHLDGRWSVRYGPHAVGLVCDQRTGSGRKTETGRLTENVSSPLGGRKGSTTTTTTKSGQITCY